MKQARPRDHALALQRPPMFFSLAPPSWWSNLYTLLFLRDSGSTRQNARVTAALDHVRDLVTWGPAFGNSPCFEGAVEPCILEHLDERSNDSAR